MKKGNNYIISDSKPVKTSKQTPLKHSKCGNKANAKNLSVAQVISYNPIIYDTEETKREYLKRLKKYLSICRVRQRKYEKAALQALEKVVTDTVSTDKSCEILCYRKYILLDFLHIMGYDLSNVSDSVIDIFRQQYLHDFSDCQQSRDAFCNVIGNSYVYEKRIAKLLKLASFKDEKGYLKLISQNLIFRNSRCFRILITATMSAGKSTLINALVGKDICKSQNQACTSKIHRIINKAFNDGLSTEYDSELVMTAGKEELYNNNEANGTDTILVATSFTGRLEGCRIMISDTPGVNFYEDTDHKRVAESAIYQKNYDLVIYVMNATQLGTNDETAHLKVIKKNIGRKPIIFALNKVDEINSDEEDLAGIIRRVKKYLVQNGFNDPVVCPVSARAAQLSKKFDATQDYPKSYTRELYNYVDKFSKMDLSSYYKKNFKLPVISNESAEEKQLQKTCGWAALEEIIKSYIRRGKQ